MQEPHYKLHGLALLTACAVLVTFCLLAFNRTFTSTVPVSVHISRAGLQLLPGSDVKVRGVIVGEVSSITSTGQGADLHLALSPSKVKLLPANLSVRLVPKTLFGEKYVDLILPSKPSSQRLTAGAVISEDRSTPSLEIDQALNDLLPFLRAIKPADLNNTLTSIADALNGRGEQLGQTLVMMRDYFRAFDPHLGTLQADWSKLAGVSQVYATAAPALLRMLGNLTVTSDSVVEQRTQLSTFLSTLTGASDETADLFDRAGNGLIGLNQTSRGALALFQEYSPEFPCLIEGEVAVIPHIKVAVPKTGMYSHEPHVVLELVPPYHSYRNPVDLPEFQDRRGPNCYGLPHPPQSLPRVHYKDGTQDDPLFQNQPGDGQGNGNSNVAAMLFNPLAGGTS